MSHVLPFRAPAPGNAPLLGDLVPLSVIEVQGFLDSAGRRLLVATDEQGRAIARGLAVATDPDDIEAVSLRLTRILDDYKRFRPSLVHDG